MKQHSERLLAGTEQDLKTLIDDCDKTTSDKADEIKDLDLQVSSLDAEILSLRTQIGESGTTAIDSEQSLILNNQKLAIARSERSKSAHRFGKDVTELNFAVDAVERAILILKT